MSVDSLRARTPTRPRGLWRLPIDRLALSDVDASASRLATLGALAVIFGVSVWLRVRGLNVHFWVDEGLSVGIAQHPLSHIPSLMRQDGSPPLYYMVLHVWISLFGRGEVATHELSLVFSMLTIPVAYWIGRTLFDRRTGLICAMLAAALPYLTTYAQETRMYSMLALLSLLAAGAFVEVFVRGRRIYLPVFILSLAASLYTHNWALFLGLMAGLAFLFLIRAAPAEQRRALWRDGLIGFGGVALLYLPWLPTVLYQSKHTGAPWDLPPVLWSLTQGLYSLVGGRGAAVALLIGAGAGLLLIREAEPRSAPAMAARCLLILGLGTLLTAFVYSKLTPAWAPRYLAIVVGPLILLFGLGLSRGRRLAMVALGLTLVFWILDPMPPSLNRKSNVKPAVAAVKAHLRPGSLVLSTQPEQIPTLAYYLPADLRYATPLGPTKDPHAFDWRDALSRFKHAQSSAELHAMISSLTPGQRVMLLVPLRFEDTPLWMKLINKTSDKWMYILNHDPSLHQIAWSSKGQNKAGIPVKATVWIKRSSAGSF
jgi:mannosyltransferase